MTTPRLTPFPATTPSAGVFAPYVIISDSDDEITTLPVRPTPPSLDRTLALYGYPLNFGDDSSNEDLSKTVKLLHTQTASTSVVHPPPTRPLPTSPAFSCRPTKEISMPVGYRAAMDQWRAASPSTCHPQLPLEIQSLSSPPPLLISPSSPPPSLLPSSSSKRSRSPSPSLPSSVSPSPPPTETMSTTNQGMSFADIEQIVAQRVANAIGTIAIYEVAKNVSNKRKWEGDYGGSSSQQQNKEHMIIRAHTAKPSNKKGYAGNLPLCNKCKFHHTGPCAAKCGNCKRVGHQARVQDPSPESEEEALSGELES
ncbi:hypothetical protein Tco_0438952 [Tanacetum coccineum]